MWSAGCALAPFAGFQPSGLWQLEQAAVVPLIVPACGLGGVWHSLQTYFMVESTLLAWHLSQLNSACFPFNATGWLNVCSVHVLFDVWQRLHGTEMPCGLT